MVVDSKLQRAGFTKVGGLDRDINQMYFIAESMNYVNLLGRKEKEKV